MEYCWHQLHQLIINSLHPDQLLTGSLKTNIIVWQQADELMKTMPYTLIEKACQAASKKQRQVFIHSCQAGGIFLANQLHSYIKIITHDPAKELGKQQVLLGYQKIKSQILDTLDLLQNQFPKNSNHNQPLPDCLFEQERRLMQEKVEEITKTWNNRIDPVLLKLLLNPAFDFINTTTTPNPSYAQWKYLIKVFERIQALSQICPPDAVTAFLYLLINCNFNQGAFIDYAIAAFQQKITVEKNMMQEMIEYNRFINYLHRLHPQPGMALNPDQPGCCEIVKIIFRQELSLLEKQYEWMQPAQNRKGSKVNAASETKEEELMLTTLSVSQLGLLFRLFVDTGILKEDNIQALMRKISRVFRTHRATAISTNHLRDKYYIPEPAAISIIKTHVVNMLNRLKQY